jgi:hypothetical protein
MAVDPSFWVLDFNAEKVRAISVLEGPYKGQVFWYMVYTVENKSSEERKAFVYVTASSDRNKTYADVYLPTVELAIEKKEGRDFWGKSNLYQVQKEKSPDDAYYHYTSFEPGQKRTCVAIFYKLDPGANRIQIQVRGLSNDLRLVEKDDGTRGIQERVLALEYERTGDVYEINFDMFRFKKQQWVTRETTLVIPESEDSGSGASASARRDSGPVAVESGAK